MAAILNFGRVFKPEVVPKVESYIEVGHVIPYILSFWRCSSSNIDGVIAISIFDLFCDLVT